MSIQGRDSNDGIDSTDGAGGEVQFFKTAKMDQPRFLTPTRDIQKLAVSPTIPSWLSNTINKKSSLQLVSTPVKENVTKYAARGSKGKKLKIDAHLTKDPATRRITAEIATYK